MLNTLAFNLWFDKGLLWAKYIASVWQDPLQALWLSKNESVGLGINPLIRKRNNSISGQKMIKEQHNE